MTAKDRLMRVSTRGILEIAEHEGIVPAPYLDSVGVLTYGIGHTKNAGGIDPASMSLAMPTNIEKAINHALEVFRTDVASYEARVNAAIKVPLSQFEFDALVSFDFNTGGIHRAKLSKRINAGDPDAADSFMGWLRPPEIRKRRTAEMQLYKTGDYDVNGDLIPIWKTNGKGKLVGQLRTMSGAEVLKRMGRRVSHTDTPPAPVHWLVTLLKTLLKLLFGGKK
jgi:lysozyme|tara:strand:+ start:40 stop:708 length:669 start_codon:yes stop_codon:yes gene_type:complete